MRGREGVSERGWWREGGEGRINKVKTQIIREGVAKKLVQVTAYRPEGEKKNMRLQRRPSKGVTPITPISRFFL